MPEYVIGLRIRASSDTAALRQAQQQLGVLHDKQLQVLNTGKKTAGMWGEIGKSIKGAVLGFGIGALISALMEGMRAAIEKQKALRGLTATVNTFWQDGLAAARAASELGDSLEKLGIDDTEVIAATRDLTRVTGDYHKALSAAALAADMASSGVVSYGEAVGMLSYLLMGRVPRSLKTFGIAAKDADDALAQLEDQVRGMSTKVNDHVTTLQQAKATVDQFWEDMGDKAIKASAKVIGFFEALQMTGHAVLTGEEDWKKYWRAFIDQGDEVQRWYTNFLKTVQKESGVPAPGAFPSAEDYFRGVEGSEPLTSKPDPEALAAAAADAAKLRAEAEIALSDSIVKAYQGEVDAAETTAEQKEQAYLRLTDAVSRMVKQQTDALNAAEAEELRTFEGAEADKANIRAGYAAKRKALVLAGAAIEVSAEQQVTEAIRAERQRRIAAEQQLADQEAQAAIDRNREYLALLQTIAQNPLISPTELLALEAEIAALKADTFALEANNLARQKRVAIENAIREGKTLDEVSAIAGDFDAKTGALDSARAGEIQADANVMDEKLKHLLSYGEAADAERLRVLDADKAAIKERLKAAIAGTEEEKALRRSLAGVEIEVAKQRAMTAIDTAGAVVAAAQAAWPQSKAVAMAAAIVNTARAVTEALPNIPLSIAIGALGAVQIAKIARTNPGGGNSIGATGPTASEKAGFDNPSHDRMAYVGGRRWAEDMVRNISAGWADGLRQAIAASGARETVTVREREVRETVRGGGTTIVNQSYLWGPQARRGAKQIGRLTDRADYARRRSIIEPAVPPVIRGGQ